MYYLNRQVPTELERTSGAEASQSLHYHKYNVLGVRVYAHACADLISCSELKDRPRLSWVVECAAEHRGVCKKCTGWSKDRNPINLI